MPNATRRNIMRTFLDLTGDRSKNRGSLHLASVRLQRRDVGRFGFGAGLRGC